MARIRWREGTLLSIPLRNGFALGQMFQEPYLVVYDQFRDDEDWDLEDPRILFFAAVARNVVSRCTALAARRPVPTSEALPRTWIHVHPSATRVTVWPGTPRQRELILIGKGGGDLVELDLRARGPRDPPVVRRDIEFSDAASLDDHELTNIRTHPEFLERLALCKHFGRNVDPLKDLLFQREIPVEYQAYVAILAGD